VSARGEDLRRRVGLAVLLAVTLGLAPASSALGGPITFLSALPVSQGEGIFRIQSLFVGFGDDPLPLDRSLSLRGYPLALAWGVTPRLAVFATSPILDVTLEVDTPRGRRTREATGLGDVAFLARYTVYQRDSSSGTLRVAPFAGLETPTGDSDRRDELGRLPRPLQLGSGSWDPRVGVVLTRQTLGWELDTAVSYQANTESDGFEFGDELRWDASYQHRVWPRRLGEGVPAFLYAVIESNLLTAGPDRARGVEDPDSGGTVWFLSPGLQYVNRRWVVEGAVQIPAAQEVNGAALERDLTAILSLRVNF